MYFFLIIFLIILDLSIKYLIINLANISYFCNNNIAFSIPFNNLLIYFFNTIIIIYLLILIHKYNKKEYKNNIFLNKKDKKFYESYIENNINKNILNFNVWRKTQKYKIISLSFIIAGAISNLIDRFIHNCVIDYIKISIFPIFNIADIFIVIATILWLYIEYKEYNNFKKSS